MVVQPRLLLIECINWLASFLKAKLSIMCVELVIFEMVSDKVAMKIHYVFHIMKRFIDNRVEIHRFVVLMTHLRDVRSIPV